VNKERAAAGKFSSSGERGDGEMTRQGGSEDPEPSRLSDPQMWDLMAAWWDQKQGEEGDLWHRLLIEPTFERVIGDVGGLRILEIACGNGRLARRMARRGAAVTAVDASEGMLLHARQREAEDPTGTEYHLADAAGLGPLADGSFDLVVAGMALMDIADARGALLEAGRALRVGGRLVASLIHPCFDTGEENSCWVAERYAYETRVFRKVGRYRELFEHSAAWRVGEREDPQAVMETPYYHRPLSWYFRALKAAGLAVTALEEPEPTEEFVAESSQGAYLREVPLHCVIEARKLGT
jgi:ubiquinone/menaquinone biosynthesis C-methylase UbiE